MIWKKELKKKAKNKIKRRKRRSVIYNKKISLEKIRDVKRKKTCINKDNKGVPPRRKNSTYKRTKNGKYLSNKKTNKYDYTLISSKIMTLNLNDNSNSNDSEITHKPKRKSKNKKYTNKFENDLIVYQNHKDSKDEKTRLNHKRSTSISKRSKSKKITKKMKNIVSFSKNSESSIKLKNKTLNKDDLNNIEKSNDLNIQELNSLKYEEALKYDKRTYFQYYFSLIKKKTFNSFYIFTYK